MGYENVEIEKGKQENAFLSTKTRDKNVEKQLSDDERIAFASLKCLFCIAKEALLCCQSATLSDPFSLNCIAIQPKSQSYSIHINQLLYVYLCVSINYTNGLKISLFRTKR